MLSQVPAQLKQELKGELNDLHLLAMGGIAQARENIDSSPVFPKPVSGGHGNPATAQVPPDLPNNRLEFRNAIENLQTISTKHKARLKISLLHIGSNQTGLKTLEEMKAMFAADNTSFINVLAFTDIYKKGLTRSILDQLR